jgi:ATPase subunit of ABC transporter with duplicated ATPase domains
MKLLVKELKPDTGSVTLGHEASIGYFPQDYKEGIKSGITALQYLESFSGDEGLEFLRGLLGRMLFSGEDALKATDKLSGGESARLILARLMLEQNNVLILDEPTNHLDLEAVSALATGLERFPGTTVFVSHDRDLVSQVATRIIALTKDGIRDFAGTYEEYLQALEEEKLGKKSAVSKFAGKKMAMA